MEYCDNCQKSLPSDRFDLHLGYCRRNIKPCPQCGLPYDINNEDDHIEEYHNLEVCEYCGVGLKKGETATHKTRCEHRPRECGYCELMVPPDKFEEHLVHCEARTRSCEKCSRPVINKQYFNHYAGCEGAPSVPAGSFPSLATPSSRYVSPSTMPSYADSSFPSASYSSSSSAAYSPGGYSAQPTMVRTYRRVHNADGTVTETPATYQPSSSYTTSYSSSNSYSNGTGYSNSTYTSSNGQTSTASRTYVSAETTGDGNVVSRRVISTRVVTHPYVPPPNSVKTEERTDENGNKVITYRTYSSPAPAPALTTPVHSQYSYSQPLHSSSQQSSFDEDPELQAALMASLGYFDQGSPA